MKLELKNEAVTKEEILHKYAKAHPTFSLKSYYQNEINNASKRINYLKNIIVDLENHQNLLEIKLGFRDDETDDIIDGYNLEIKGLNKLIERSSNDLKSICC